VPYRTLSYPAISLFEHRLALKRIKDINKQHVDEATLFKAIDEIRSIIKAAASTTRSARRNQTRIQENNKIQPKPKAGKLEMINQDKSERLLKHPEDRIEPFTNIEVW